MSKVVSIAKAIEKIKDNAVISVSSSSGLGCPDATLKALGERFDQTGCPKNITSIHPIAAGDMYGIKGVDYIAKDGLLSRIIGGSYPSGPSSMDMPEIWKMIVENRVLAYNVPSGILFDMHKEVASKKVGVLTQTGIETFVDPKHQGCAMNEVSEKAPIVTREHFKGKDWLYFPNINIDVAIIRATTADTKGNLTYEHEGAYLGALEQALAARNCDGIVIAQVKRVTRHGSLRSHDVRVPSNLVDYVVVDEDQMQTTSTPYNPAISGEVTSPLTDFDIPTLSVEKVLARRAALELKAEQTANLGFGISALIPRVMIEEGLSDQVNWAIEQGAVGGVPLTGFAFGCSSNADAYMPSPQQFTFFQGGGFDVSFLSFMEVDAQGNVNVSKLAKKPYLTAGCGGFVDIVSHAKKLVFTGYFEAGAQFDLTDKGLMITKPGKFTKFVEQVEHITFSGNRAIELNQDITYITERCVIKLTKSGLQAIEIMPGIDPQKHIVEASQGRVSIADNAKLMSLDLLKDSPMGLKLNSSRGDNG